jgi:hypothetical protein
MTRRFLNVDTYLPKVIMVVFILTAALLATHHELWRDEIQPWLIAKNSSTLSDLYRNMEYEGHAMIWPLMLFVLTRFSEELYWIQVVHLALAVMAVYVFLRFSPFTALWKGLFVLGYFTLYEYCIVCRPYVIGFLLLHCFCVVFRRSGGRNILALAAIIFLLCQTSVYGILLALALVFMLLFKWFYEKEWRLDLLGRKPVLAVAMAVIVMGVVISIAQLKPPEDTGFATEWHLGLDLGRLGEATQTVWRSYVPVPRPQIEFWDTNILTIAPAQSILSLVAVVFFIFCFLDRPPILSLYCSGTLAIISFTYLKYIGRIRHHGHLFMLLIVCLWLADKYPPRKLGTGLGSRLARFARTHTGKVVLFILVAQLVGAVIAGGVDLIHPFSAAQEVAEYLKAKHLDGMLIVGDKDYAAMGVSGHLGKEIYYPRAGRMGTYVVYDRERRYMRPIEVLRSARALSNERKEDVLLLLDYELETTVYGVVKIREFSESIEPSERFNLYLMKYRPKAGQSQG